MVNNTAPFTHTPPRPPCACHPPCRRRGRFDHTSNRARPKNGTALQPWALTSGPAAGEAGAPTQAQPEVEGRSGCNGVGIVPCLMPSQPRSEGPAAGRRARRGPRAGW